MEQLLNIKFSEKTYQIQIKNKGEEYWVFLQLDDEDKIKDVFCSCDDEEEKCPHIKIALKSIYSDKKTPLHQRFKASLWNRLCEYCAREYGYEEKILKKKSSKQYSLQKDLKHLFSVEATSNELQTKLKTLLEKRKQETETNSIKFSNLTEKELNLWKAGEPSHSLRYELSFWSDLAKLMMLSQESKEKYKIEFGYSKDGLPNSIKISFPLFSISFSLSKELLLKIIPSLTTVNSPLKVEESQQNNLEKITYDKKEKALHLLIDKKNKTLPKEQVDLSLARDFGSWKYIPKKGFFVDSRDDFFNKEVIKESEIASFLDKHANSFKGLFDGITLNLEEISASYKLSFDKTGNLNINCYAFAPKDLEKGFSSCFGTWVYLDDKGFYRFDDSKFEKLSLTIPRDQVSDFISEHKHWLSMQEGFQVHLMSVTSKIAYEITELGEVHFFSCLSLKEKGDICFEFDSWVYVQNAGFYAKKPINPDVCNLVNKVVKKNKVAEFIRKNYSQLECIDGFFFTQCPILKAKLKLKFCGSQKLNVFPEYELSPGYSINDIQVFKEFIFIKNRGFCLVPKNLHIPSHFAEPQVFQGEALSFFIKYELEGLLPYIIDLDPRLRKIDNIEMRIKSFHSNYWEKYGLIGVNIVCQISQEEIPVTDFWQAMIERKAIFFSQHGYIDLLQKKLNWLHRLSANRVDLPKKQILLSVLELIHLCVSNEVSILIENKEKEHSDVLKELSKFIQIRKCNLKDMRGELRKYQSLGVDWLWQLYQYRLSGLLCDDMGLGKTHQAMALLTSVYNQFHQDHKIRPLFLIVCPTSVIYHWEDKLKEYLPDLPIFTFYGYKRSLGLFLNSGGVLLTSYGVLRVEKERLKNINFEVAIFDEIQSAKNSRSRTFATLISLKTRMRLGMTGTPIENNLRELKALFDIVLPGYMPIEKRYDKHFIVPIEKKNDKERQQELSNLIKPFMLRRKKEEVLSELPEKITEIACCDLSSEQCKLYNQIIENSKHSFIQEIGKTSGPNYIHVFALLTKLKQICDHPAVFLKDPASYENYSSGKWELFLELLSEARASKQKVVVFSHYLNMIDIMRRYLTKNKIQFALVKGDTTDRAEQLKRFNTDPNCEVFVGSLQTIGMGVDLTAASVVIHYDRWWNAARENQATDRVHRIGQKQGVQVFKLMVKKTYEEKIDQMISKKNKMLEEIVGYDEQNIIKQLNHKELFDLFKPIN